MTILIGQEAQERDFIEAQTGARGAHAWLLTGPKGIGKAGFAGQIVQQAAVPQPARVLKDLHQIACG